MIDISRIQQLLVQAPQPPKEVLPGGIADAECDAFEQRTGICLPDEIRQWLNVANGPCIGPGGLYGIQTQHLHLDMETILGMFPFWRTRKWIPIAGDDAGTAPGI